MSGTKRRGAAAGAGLVGAAVLGATYFFADGDEEVPPTSEIAEETQVPPPGRMAPAVEPVQRERVRTGLTFCAPAIIEGDGCAEAEGLAAQVPALIRSDALPSKPVTLVSPEDGAEETASDCQRYAALRRDGYGAATSAGMAREAQLARVCGLVMMAGRAEEASGPPPGTGLFSLIPRGELPGLGEATFDPEAAITVASDDPLIWTVEDDSLEGEFVHIATADFDGDPAAEYLIEWRLQAKGGTLRAIGYGLAEARPVSFRTVDPFAF